MLLFSLINELKVNQITTITIKNSWDIYKIFELSVSVVTVSISWQVYHLVFNLFDRLLTFVFIPSNQCVSFDSIVLTFFIRWVNKYYDIPVKKISYLWWMMKLPSVQHCCCFNLKTGVIITAIIWIFLSIWFLVFEMQMSYATHRVYGLGV